MTEVTKGRGFPPALCIQTDSGMKRSKLFAVAFADLLVPVERILSFPVQVAVAVIVLVDIDEAVALLHFTGGSGDKVNAAP